MKKIFKLMVLVGLFSEVNGVSEEYDPRYTEALIKVGIKKEPLSLQDYNNLRELFNFSPTVTTEEIKAEFYAQMMLDVLKWNEYFETLPLETQVLLQERVIKEIEVLKTQALVEKAVESTIKVLESQDFKKIVGKKMRGLQTQILLTLLVQGLCDGTVKAVYVNS